MLNMEFDATVMVNLQLEPWLSSPMPGVERKPLARESAERGHATSIVRYLPGSVFRAHPHPLGEEILVLEGVFSDESGDFPAGSYFRNPPGSSHAPYSKDGCVLFVKLHQFQPSDQEHVVTKVESDQLVPGVPVVLHQFGDEQVCLVCVTPSTKDLLCDWFHGSLEMLIIRGDIEYAGVSLPALSWLRTPMLNWSDCKVEAEVILWLKIGHF